MMVRGSTPAPSAQSRAAFPSTVLSPTSVPNYPPPVFSENQPAIPDGPWRPVSSDSTSSLNLNDLILPNPSQRSAQRSQATQPTDVFPSTMPTHSPRVPLGQQSWITYDPQYDEPRRPRRPPIRPPPGFSLSPSSTSSSESTVVPLPSSGALPSRSTLARRSRRPSAGSDPFGPTYIRPPGPIGPPLHLTSSSTSSRRDSSISSDGLIPTSTYDSAATLTTRHTINGNVNGSVNGNINGHINGYINDNTNGNVSRYPNGNINGNTNGNLTRNLNGNVNGVVNGNINGYITSNINGYLNSNTNRNINGNINGSNNNKQKSTPPSNPSSPGVIGSGRPNGIRPSINRDYTPTIEDEDEDDEEDPLVLPRIQRGNLQQSQRFASQSFQPPLTIEGNGTQGSSRIRRRDLQQSSQMVLQPLGSLPSTERFRASVPPPAPRSRLRSGMLLSADQQNEFEMQLLLMKEANARRGGHHHQPARRNNVPAPRHHFNHPYQPSQHHHHQQQHQQQQQRQFHQQQQQQQHHPSYYQVQRLQQPQQHQQNHQQSYYNHTNQHL